jgi:hypothetical protein
VADTLALLSTAPLFQQKKPATLEDKFYKSASVEQQGSLKLIVPSGDNSPYEELYLYSRAETIFEYLAGQKSYDFITSSQF